MKDTAEEVGTIEQCLYSLGNRVSIAKILCENKEIKLLETELEDIAYFTQAMLDEHCIVKEDGDGRRNKTNTD